MAIGRISGPMLFSNLERQGIDLAFDSNLIYLDVTNRRIGINSTSPQFSIDSPGNVKVASILIQGNSISSNTGVVDLGTISNITIAGGAPNYVIYTDGNGNLAWGQISDLDASWGNLLLANNSIIVTATNGNLILQANGTGSVTTTNDFYAANVYATNITGVINSASGNVTANLSGNISGTFGDFSGNLYSDWLEANVTGSYGNFNTVNVNGTVTASGNIVAQKITSPTGDIHIGAATDNPNNIIRFDSVSAFDIPSGTTDQRPPNPDFGYVRYNTDIGSVEWWGGSQWVSGSNLISTQQIVPDGTSTTYTLTQSTVENAILVNINGTIQQAGSGAYSVSGNQITFAETPFITDIIEIRYLASGVAALTINFANIASNVSPSANVTYDLGSVTNRWRDLWLSGNTIHLGEATLSSSGTAIQLPAGSTVGGANVDVNSINANIAAANAAIISANTSMKTYVDQGLADAIFVAGSYGNAVVAQYLPLDPTITTMQANVGAYQTYANANVVAIQANIDAYQTYANANVVAMQANVGAYQIFANANAASQQNNIITIQSNIGAYQTYANTRITNLQSILDTSYVDTSANIGAFQKYANTKIGTNTNSNLVVTAGTASTSNVTGALVVRGGVGITGNIYANGRAVFGQPGTASNVVVAGTTASSSTSSGALVVRGGVGVAGTLNASTVNGVVVNASDAVQASGFVVSTTARITSASELTTWVGGLTQSNVDISTDVDVTNYFGSPASNYYHYVTIQVAGQYIANVAAPTTQARLLKSWSAGVWYNETTSTWLIEGEVLQHTAFNTDATNFPAGAVGAGKVFLTGSGTGSLVLRFTNRTSPAATSATYWQYKLQVSRY